MPGAWVERDPQAACLPPVRFWCFLSLLCCAASAHPLPSVPPPPPLPSLPTACTPDGSGVTYNEHINIAMAVAMPDGGLITPVLKDADATDIYTMSRNWADLVGGWLWQGGSEGGRSRHARQEAAGWRARRRLRPRRGMHRGVRAPTPERPAKAPARPPSPLLPLSPAQVKRARGKQLAPDEYSTGTFTISNLGMFGVESFDAILPPGTSAILAVGGSQPVVTVDGNGRIGVEKQMVVNLTADHRTVYGAHAAEFLQTLKAVIESPDQLVF